MNSCHEDTLFPLRPPRRVGSVSNGYVSFVDQVVTTVEP